MIKTIIGLNSIIAFILFLYFLVKEYLSQMITWQELRLLKKIRKAQCYEDGTVIINLKEKTIESGIWNDKSKTRKETVRTKNLKKTLQSLEKEKWISYLQDMDDLGNEKSYTANHHAWHIKQIVLAQVIKSILIPMIVSILTVIIVSFINL